MDLGSDFVQEIRTDNVGAAEGKIKKILGMKPVLSMTCEEMLEEIALWDCLYKAPAPSENARRQQQQVRKELPERFKQLCTRYINECLGEGTVEKFLNMLASFLKMVRCPFGNCFGEFFGLARYKCRIHEHVLGSLSTFIHPLDITPRYMITQIKQNNEKWKDPTVENFLKKFAKEEGSFPKQQQQQQQSQGGGGAKKRAKVQHASQRQMGLPEPLWTPTDLKPAAQQPPPLVQAAAAGGGGAASSAAVPRQQQQQQAKRQRQRQPAGKTDT